MTTDLAFTVFRIGFLVLLWLLVLAAVNTLRRDIFGTVVTPRGKGRDKAASRRKASRTRRKETKRTMAKIWDNFLTNDLSGVGHGLATVQQYLIEIGRAHV